MMLKINNKQLIESKINIVNLFSSDELTETSSGFKTVCPDCGLQGGRTEGFILFPETNTAYCHSSGKWFKMLEVYALKKQIIRCLDGREKGDAFTKVLGGELFTLTLEEFKNEYGTELYNQLITELNIRKSVEIAGNNRLMSDFCDDLGDIYKSRNVLFFRGESRDIVEIGRYKKINQEGQIYVENGFVSVTGTRFITLAEMFIKPWTTFYTRNGDIRSVSKSMNQSMGNIALASPNLQNKLPVITRIFDTQIPIIYKEELTFPKKGYDSRFGSWLPYNSPMIKEDLFKVEEAKKLIDKIFEEFCFETEKDKTHAIAGFITPFLRGLFSKFSIRTPVFIYMANRERAGKDYCAGCSGIIYEGSKTEEPAISNDERGNSNEEIRKKIMACMIQGKKRFHSANNKGLLNNSIFEGVTTAEVWSDRILGRSEIVTFNNEIDYSLSGNIGIKLTPDLVNRGRIINLHLYDENANARKFKNPDLHGWLLKNREIIISALYTLVKHWNDLGRPEGSIPFTSFPEWSKICGGIMESCGYDNPCKSEKILSFSLDPETEEMKQLFECCYEKNPDVWMSKQEIRNIIESDNIFNYFNFSDKADQTKFGQKIEKFSRRILSDILMEVDSLEQRASRRKYKFTKNIKYTSTSPKIEKNDEIGIMVRYGNLKISPFEIKTDKINENDDKSGNLVTIGNYLPTLEYPTKGINTGVGEMLPIVTKLPSLNNEKVDKSLSNITNSSSKLESLQDFTDKYNIRIKEEESVKRPKKEKSDRELQFYEDPQCADIVEECTKEEVFEWFKKQDVIDTEQMFEDLGLGCHKYLVEFYNEGMVIVNELGDIILKDGI